MFFNINRISINSLKNNEASGGFWCALSICRYPSTQQLLQMDSVKLLMESERETGLLFCSLRIVQNCLLWYLK